MREEMHEAIYQDRKRSAEAQPAPAAGDLAEERKVARVYIEFPDGCNSRKLFGQVMHALFDSKADYESPLQLMRWPPNSVIEEDARLEELLAAAEALRYAPSLYGHPLLDRLRAAIAKCKVAREQAAKDAK